MRKRLAECTKVTAFRKEWKNQVQSKYQVVKNSWKLVKENPELLPLLSYTMIFLSK